MTFDKSITEAILDKQFVALLKRILKDEFAKTGKRVAYEVLYDDAAQNVVGYKEVDPDTLKLYTTPGPNGTMETFWYQNVDNPALCRKLYDTQIIYLW